MKTLPLTLTDRVVKPARLVVITRRDGTVMRIAEAQTAITVDGNVYTPLAGCRDQRGQAHARRRRAVDGDRRRRTTTPAPRRSRPPTSTSGCYDAAEVQLYIVNRANPTTLGLLFTGTIQPVSYDISGRVSFDVRGPAVGAGTGYIQTLRADVPHRSVLARCAASTRIPTSWPPRSPRSSTVSTSRSRSRRRRRLSQRRRSVRQRPALRSRSPTRPERR